MKSRTYYEILGVSRDASIEEITIAKNALAKVYHPDANAHKDIDTTAFMQEILEAYQTLSDPEKRKGYDAQFFGNSEPVERVFKTFKLEPEEKTAESVCCRRIPGSASVQIIRGIKPDAQSFGVICTLCL